nr:PREDICTED: uncharacterized protein LOC109037965 [Bemisia tabaci]
MKSSIAVLAVLSVFACVQAQDAKQKVAAVAEKCKTEVRGGHDVLKIVGTSELPKTEEQRCFLECVYKNLQLIVDDKFAEPGAKRLMMMKYGSNPDQLKIAQTEIETCAKEVKPTAGMKCSLAHNIRQCFAKEGQKHNFYIKA